MTSNKLVVNDWQIWYEKFGCGSNPLLLIPGAIGTGRSDFKHQLEGDNALDMEKYTIIAVELPGWGRSRPPLRPYGSDVFNIDAKCCVELMQNLGFEKFSILGWSDGAKVALIIAANYPNCVKSVIMSGIIALATQKNVKSILMIKDIDNWSRDMIQNYLKAYKDLNEIQQMWSRHMTFVTNFIKYFPNGICDKYDSIVCPVLIIHGDRDPLVQLEQPLHVLKNIKNAKIHRFALGSHNLHQIYQNEFKQIVEQFLNKN